MSAHYPAINPITHPIKSRDWKIVPIPLVHAVFLSVIDANVRSVVAQLMMNLKIIITLEIKKKLSEKPVKRELSEYVIINLQI